MVSWGWVRFTVLALCVLMAAEVGLRRAWADVTVDPPGPPPVCQLVRAEVFDVLVPNRGPLEAEGEEGSTAGTRSNTCEAESRSAVDGARASLWVALARIGRHDGQGPECIRREGSLLRPINRTNHRVALGDGGSYYFASASDAARTVHLSVCLGTYLVYVRYETVGATEPAVVDGAVAVAQEVLSWL
ncbi:hypothetical protein AB0J20_26335 [Micromonospora costi]|uniref:hypothetical protein n=1 Tax=Micromonospora costi TaxID=1530042 RepID=UPI0033E3EA4C